MKGKRQAIEEQEMEGEGIDWTILVSW